MNLPRRKWFRVKTSKSSGLSLIWVKGKLFTIASISIKTVHSWNSVSSVLFIMLQRPSLTVFISLSHTRPIWSEAGGLKFFVILLSAENSLTFLASIFNSLTFPLKLVPKSLNISSGLPLLFINFCKLLMKLSVSRPSATSKSIWRVVKQVNKAPQRFSQCTKNHIFLFQKNRAGAWFFLYHQERWHFFFPKIWIFFLRTENGR